MKVILGVILALVGAQGALAATIPGHAYAGSRPVGDAVVWLDVKGPSDSGEKRHAVLDQRNLTFLPHVLVIQVPTVVSFPNHDRVFHNVFSYHDGRKFDLGLYPAGATKDILFPKPGLSRLFCNIHPNMSAYIMAVDTPCFAVSRADGAFALPAVPPGHYVYHAWRPGQDEIHGTLEVEPGKPVEVRWAR